MAIGGLMTTKEVAERLGITRGRVHQLVDAGRLRPQKAGPILLFYQHEIEDFAKVARPGGRPKKAS